MLPLVLTVPRVASFAEDILFAHSQDPREDS